MSDDPIEQAKESIRQVIPYIRSGIADAKKEAKEEGRVEIGILAVRPDGTGQVICRFEACEFFEDLAKVVGAPPQTEEDELNAQAKKLVDMVEASGGTIVNSPAR